MINHGYIAEWLLFRVHNLPLAYLRCEKEEMKVKYFALEMILVHGLVKFVVAVAYHFYVFLATYQASLYLKPN